MSDKTTQLKQVNRNLFGKNVLSFTNKKMKDKHENLQQNQLLTPKITIKRGSSSKSSCTFGCGTKSRLKTISSDFSNQTKYLIYILVDFSQNNSEQIKAYVCQCKTGLKTVGCCAHIMANLWYLGFAQHSGEIPTPTGNLNNFFLELSHSDSDSKDTE